MTTTTITSPIPTDLANIPGIATGFRPTDINHGRFVIAGRGGSGKSTLIHSNPQAFILDPEGGGNTVDDPQALTYTAPRTVQPGKLAEAYMTMAKTITDRAAKGATDYTMLVLDTMDEFVDIFLTDFCFIHKIDDPLEYQDGNGNGYSIVAKQIFGMLSQAYRAGMGWTILAHIEPKTKKVGGQDRTIISFAVSDSFRKIMKRKCEHMIFIEFENKSVLPPPTFKKVASGKTIEIQGKAVVEAIRVVKTTPGGCWEGDGPGENKVRLPFPERTELPPVGGWDVLSDVYDKAVILRNPDTGDKS